MRISGQNTANRIEFSYLMKKHVLIVGGGFVGLRTAILLARHSELKDGKITLVSDQKTFVFTPWLVDLLAGDIKLEEMTANLEDVAKREGFTFLLGKVSHIDREQKIALVETSKGQEKLAFDAAALCQGASTNYYGIAGADTFAFQIKTPEHVAKLIEKLDQLPNEVSVCVVGAGPTGVEAAFAMQDRLTHMKKTAKISLLQAAPRILPGFSASLVQKVKRYLADANIMVMEGDPVTVVEADGVRLKSGSRMACHVVVWAGGIKPNQVDIQPALPNDTAGCISVDRTLQADEHVFAAGDVCGVLNPGVAAPKTAQVAMEMAPMLADNIIRELRGEELQPYTHHSKGTIITAGHVGLLELGWKQSFASSMLYNLRNFFYRGRFRMMVGK